MQQHAIALITGAGGMSSLHDFFASTWWTRREALIAAAIVVLALGAPSVTLNLAVRVQRLFAPLTTSGPRAVAAVFLLCIVARLALLPLIPLPCPSVHDEFSYLLAGDTFASGRLANPPLPEGDQLIPFHVLVSPTYISKYPPGQGMTLALGKLLGHPWIGVLLTTAAAAACVTWALLAWLSPGWAFVAGVVFIARVGTVSYWMNSYWGGSLACLGAALALGAYGRLGTNARRRDGAFFGLGLAILANTRPYEGTIFAAALCIALAWSALRKRSLRHAIIPAVAVLALAAAWMGYYNWRTTGSPAAMPYAVYTARDHIPPFLFSEPRASAPESGREAKMDAWTASVYEDARSNPLRHLVLGAFQPLSFILGPLLVLPICLAGFRKPVDGSSIRVPVIACVAVLAGVLLETWATLFPAAHYAAPALPGLYLLMAVSLRKLAHVQSRPWSNALAALVLAAVVVLVPIAAADRGPTTGVAEWANHAQFGACRAPFERRLATEAGEHLVLVRYDERSYLHTEYVYNGANPQNQRVIWARSIDPSRDARLAERFPNRTVWVLDATRGELTRSLP